MQPCAGITAGNGKTAGPFRFDTRTERNGSFLKSSERNGNGFSFQ